MKEKDHFYFTFENITDEEELVEQLEQLETTKAIELCGIGSNSALIYTSKSKAVKKVRDIIHSLNDGMYVSYRAMTAEEADSYL